MLNQLAAGRNGEGTAGGVHFVGFKAANLGRKECFGHECDVIDAQSTGSRHTIGLAQFDLGGNAPYPAGGGYRNH